jgi:acyl-CoA thioesterase
MDAITFLGLEATDDPRRWRLPVTPGVCTGGNFLFGGAGLGAGIAVLEAAAGRPLVWATAQYLSFARPPDVMDLEATIAVEGHHVTQARVVGRVGDREILTVNGALGERSTEEATGEWAIKPDVPPPDACPPRVRWRGPAGAADGDGDDISSRLDVRMAEGRSIDEMDGRPGTGRHALWARMPDLLDMSPAALGILGDYVPSGISQALGMRAGGRSLDNTLRVARLVPTEWVLLDVRIHAVANGMGHGLVHQWAEDGTLLATASQSAIVRRWR